MNAKVLKTFASRAATIAAVMFALWPATLVAWQAAAPQELPTAQGEQPQRQRSDTDNHPYHPLHEIDDAMIRLPLAAALGAALALRPKRRGTPLRQPAVVQTQIILAVVGAVIMLVVGASLARAFGIVGAANLIRYRSKIEDPKDAVVMLCALAVGLASGVGLYALGVFSTVFLVIALWVIESFEPKSQNNFNLKFKAGQDTDALRPKLERILNRYGLDFELRSSSDEEVCYDVRVPHDVQTDEITNSLLRLDPDGHAAVEWAEKKAKAK
jgi:uncharacterized membrane protein YhiD involved in acid resistance